MSALPHTRRGRTRLALVALPIAGFVGLVGGVACGSSPAPSPGPSASSAAAVAPTGTAAGPVADDAVAAPTIDLPAISAVPDGPVAATGGGSPAIPTPPPPPPTTASAPSTDPVITSIGGPATVDCEEGSTGFIDVTITYTAENTVYIEYLRPGGDRPGATSATGSVMSIYDCNDASGVFMIRAFDEFIGSDSKQPSPYVSITVQRNVVPSGTTSTTQP